MARVTASMGFDLTKNQSAVLSVLEKAGKPLGAYDILDEVRDVGLKGPPQVYRALDKLVTLGLVHRIESLNAFLACDHGPHEEPAAFFICRECGKTIELPLSSVEALTHSNALPKDCHVDEVKVEMKGQCGDCVRTAALQGASS